MTLLIIPLLETRLLPPSLTMRVKYCQTTMPAECKQRIGIAALIRNADEKDKYRSENRGRDQRLQQHPEQSHDGLAVANRDLSARQHQHEFAVRPDIARSSAKDRSLCGLIILIAAAELILPSVSRFARAFQRWRRDGHQMSHITVATVAHATAVRVTQASHGLLLSGAETSHAA